MTATPPPEGEVWLLGAPRSMTRGEVSERAAVSLRLAGRFWRALGFQAAADDVPIFAEADLEALRQISRLVEEGALTEDLAVGMVRAFARTADRLSVWQTQLVAEALAPEVGPGEEAGPVPPEAAEAAAARLATVADELEPLLVYAWRRHLTGAIGRLLADARGEDRHDHAAPVRVVGFADLVSFTSLVRRLSEREVARLVQRFEELATDVVTAHGGRIIKTVGDEVLFLHLDPAPAAAIALDLLEAMAEDELLPPVRVGMAHGQVVSRLGDVFGTTVNRASRLTAVTPAGSVHVDEALARALASVSGFRTVPQRRRTLRGLGPVVPHELYRAQGGRRERL